MYQSKRSEYDNERVTSSDEDRYHPDPKFSSPTADSRYGEREASYLFRVPNEHSEAFGWYITDACLEVRGLAHAASCYELCLLYLFYKEYIAKLPDGEAVLSDYRRKAPRIARALGAERDVQHVRLQIYARYLAPAVALIVNGRWDEAYEIYRAICQDMEKRYLASGTSLWRSVLGEEGVMLM